jgi:hypothetical protein
MNKSHPIVSIPFYAIQRIIRARPWLFSGIFSLEAKKADAGSQLPFWLQALGYRGRCVPFAGKVNRMEGLVLLTGVTADEPFVCQSPNQLAGLAAAAWTNEFAPQLGGGLCGFE